VRRHKLKAFDRNCNEVLRERDKLNKIDENNSILSVLFVFIRRRKADSVYVFKCKRFRNTRHTVTFGIPLYSYF
jgi:hypothetical protein